MLPMYTRILTPKGFAEIKTIQVGDTIYSLDTTSNILVPATVVSNNTSVQEVWKFENKRTTLFCSPSLKLKGWRRSKTRGKPSIKVDTIFEIGKATQEHNAITVYPVADGTRSVCNLKSELLGYIASDGYWSWSKRAEVTSSSNGVKKQVDCSLSQAEHKFVKEIKSILDDLGAKYSMYKKESMNENAVYGFHLSSPWVRNYLQELFSERLDKHDVNWTEFILSLDKESFDSFYQGFYNGDGTLGYSQIAQNPGKIQDGVVAAMIRKGLGVVSKNRRSDGTLCEVVRYHTKKHITMQEISKGVYSEEVCYSPLTEHGSCVIMQHDFIGTVFIQ